MPRFGRYGPSLKAPHLRKSSRGHLRKRHQAGSIPAVKRGLKNAGENAIPSWLLRLMLWRDISDRGRAYSAVRAGKDHTAQPKFAPRPGCGALQMFSDACHGAELGQNGVPTEISSGYGFYASHAARADAHLVKQTWRRHILMSALPPESGHSSADPRCPLSANSGHSSETTLKPAAPSHERFVQRPFGRIAPAIPRIMCNDGVFGFHILLQKSNRALK